MSKRACPFWIVSYYIKWVKTSWTYSRRGRRRAGVEDQVPEPGRAAPRPRRLVPQRAPPTAQVREWYLYHIIAPNTMRMC